MLKLEVMEISGKKYYSIITEILCYNKKKILLLFIYLIYLIFFFFFKSSKLLNLIVTPFHCHLEHELSHVIWNVFMLLWMVLLFKGKKWRDFRSLYHIKTRGSWRQWKKLILRCDNRMNYLKRIIGYYLFFDPL